MSDSNLSLQYRFDSVNKSVACNLPPNDMIDTALSDMAVLYQSVPIPQSLDIHMYIYLMSLAGHRTCFRKFNLKVIV